MFILFVVSLLLPSFFTLIYFSLSLVILLNFMGIITCRFRPSLLHSSSAKLITYLRIFVFVNIVVISLYQFPAIPDGSHGSRDLVLFLRLFGIEKYGGSSDSAVCLGNGVDHATTELVECRKYWEIRGMGVYAILLVSFYLYVPEVISFKLRNK